MYEKIHFTATTRLFILSNRAFLLAKKKNNYYFTILFIWCKFQVYSANWLNIKRYRLMNGAQVSAPEIYDVELIHTGHKYEKKARVHIFVPLEDLE